MCSRAYTTMREMCSSSVVVSQELGGQGTLGIHPSIIYSSGTSTVPGHEWHFLSHLILLNSSSRLLSFVSFHPPNPQFTSASCSNTMFFSKKKLTIHVHVGATTTGSRNISILLRLNTTYLDHFCTFHVPGARTLETWSLP